MVAIVTKLVVSSFAHIEASTKMVPVPVSLTDPNSDAANSGIGAFRDDHWFVADVQRTGNAGIVRTGTRKACGWGVRRPDPWQYARMVFL